MPLPAIDQLVIRYPELSAMGQTLADGYAMLEACFRRGNKLLIAGNGGSAADAQHIVGELMKGFLLPRRIPDSFAQALSAVNPQRGALLTANLQGSLRAISLGAHEALTSAYLNDKASDCVYAQQLYGYADPGDVLLAISTSGNSRNILNAAVTAKAMGVQVLALTGQGGGELAQYADLLVAVPAKQTYRAQELHVPIYHVWCAMLEDAFFNE